MRKQLLVSGLLILLSVFTLMIHTGCSQDKYSKFKSEDYKTAWNQMNDLILKSKNQELNFEDIKDDSILKAAISEMVRRAENPDKKIPVDTISKSEEKQILENWESVLYKVTRNETYFKFFENKLEQAAVLLYESGYEKVNAYKEVAQYLFYTKLEFDHALDLMLNAGFAMKEASDAIFEPLSTAGSGAYGYCIGHENEMLAFFLRVGKSKQEAYDFVGGSIAYISTDKIRNEKLSEEEVTAILEEATRKVMEFVKDEKETAKLIGRALSRNKPFIAVKFLEKANDQEYLKRVYYEMASDYFWKEDYQNALLYYEKSGDKEKLEQLKEYLKKIGK